MKDKSEMTKTQTAEEYAYYRYEDGLNALCDALWTAKTSLSRKENETAYDAYYDIELMASCGHFDGAKRRFDERAGGKKGKRLNAVSDAFDVCFALSHADGAVSR